MEHITKIPLSFRQLFGIFFVCAAGLLIAGTLQAWTGPTATAPDGNVPAPINVGTTDQIKNGGLSVNALTVFGSEYVQNKLGIGVVSPLTQLDVAGTIKIGNTGEQCQANMAGGIRYNSTSKIMEYCNGTVWCSFAGCTTPPPLNSKIVFVTSGSSWTVPANWNSANNTVEVIAGGAGGNNASGSIYSGGGGGAYAKTTNLSLTPGNSVTYGIGLGGTKGQDGGDTWFNAASFAVCTSSSVCVSAQRGSVDKGSGAGGAGGAAAKSVGQVTYSGGNGGKTSGNGGSGGGAAGQNGDGIVGGSNYGNGGAGDAGLGGVGGKDAYGGVSAVNNGGNGDEWDSKHGSGGGGGGNAKTGSPGANGGSYGGGAGGAPEASGGTGFRGVIVITYTPAF